MASSYALPQPPVPHGHNHHGSDGHIHSHSHSHSHSPSFGHSRRSNRSNGHIHSFSQSRGSLHEHDHHDDHDHGHEHEHGPDHDHDHDHAHDDVHAQAQQRNLSQYRANSFVPLQRRENRLSPLRQPSDEPSYLLDKNQGIPPVPSTPSYVPPSVAVLHEHDYDSDHDHAHNHHDDHDHGHGHGHDHDHDHEHSHDAGGYSKFTALLLPHTSKVPLIHAIMTEKDSRRIFYFMAVNFTFMGVQAVYGYLTDSLGLLSDSIHMFFDCVALAVGLFASVMSKWPPSDRFPYGFGKIETLSGFANGVFLILISLEIMFEGFERLVEGRETKRLQELFIVSTLGLIVNLLGIFAFGSHAHHGHSHGHDHSHGHGHSHSHAHDHDHDHGHCDSHDGHGHAHSHHSHDNENMHGIYLHILADTLGSASVILSTILTYILPWSGWDPLASLLIAYLILITAMPLVKSSAQRLLLTIPADTEYNLRDTLSEITNQRGVAAYAVPKFWVDDRAGTDSGGKLLGVIHVAVVRGADMEEVRDRVKNHLAKHGIELTIQMEREGDAGCWCGMGRLNPSMSISSKPPLGY